MLSRCCARGSQPSTSSLWSIKSARLLHASTSTASTTPSPGASATRPSGPQQAPGTPRSRLNGRITYPRDHAAIPRDLPKLQSTTPILLAIAALASLTWGSFVFYATNNERANSSVVRSLAFQCRASPVVRDFLGDNVKLPTLIGEFRRVKGSINMLAGKIDVQFRVQGSKAAGTAMFTSVRRGKEGKFEVLRWKIIRDDGEVLDMRTMDPRTTGVDALNGQHLV